MIKADFDIAEPLSTLNPGHQALVRRGLAQDNLRMNEGLDEKKTGID